MLRICFCVISVLLSNCRGNSMPNSAFRNPLSRKPTNGRAHSNNSLAVQSTNCLSVVDHFVGLVLKGLNQDILLKAEVHFEKLGKKKSRKAFLFRRCEPPEFSKSSRSNTQETSRFRKASNSKAVYVSPILAITLIMDKAWVI